MTTKQTIGVHYELIYMGQIFMSGNASPVAKIDVPSPTGSFFGSDEWRAFQDLHVAESKNKNRQAVFIINCEIID